MLVQQALPALRVSGRWHCGVAAIDIQTAIRDVRAAATLRPSVIVIDDMDVVFAGDDSSEHHGVAFGNALDGPSLLLLAQLIAQPPQRCFVIGISTTPDAVLQV